MGSEQPGETVTLTEAAELLEVTGRTVLNMVKRGRLIPTMRKGRSAIFSRADVLAAKAADSDRNVSEGDVVAIALQARAAAHAAERSVQHLYDFLGLSRVTVDRTPEGIVSMYREMSAGGSRKQLLDAAWVRHWALTMMSFDEDFLCLAEEALGTSEPWQYILAFASGVLLSPREDGALEELRQAYVLFEQARRQVRMVSYFYARTMGGKGHADSLFTDERLSRMDVLERLLS